MRAQQRRLRRAQRRCSQPRTFQAWGACACGEGPLVVTLPPRCLVSDEGRPLCDCCGDPLEFRCLACGHDLAPRLAL